MDFIFANLVTSFKNIALFLNKLAQNKYLQTGIINTLLIKK
jgi:hypothetical protein